MQKNAAKDCFSKNLNKKEMFKHLSSHLHFTLKYFQTNKNMI